MKNNNKNNKDNKNNKNNKNRYMELIEQFPLRPICSEEELNEAIIIIDSLIDIGKLSKDEDDYLSVLGGLVEKYESENYHMSSVSDIEMLKYLIEMRGITQIKVSIDTGIGKSTISEILSGKRKLNRKHIELLARYFHVSPAVFMNT